MDLVERFHKALHAEPHDQRGDSDLLPVGLARAAAAVLPVDGAGLGIHEAPDRRTPLAASERTAALAERLEFTVGHGPCLLSAELAFPVLATEEVLAQKWPVFHDLLLSETPIHSVLALPLTGRLRGRGTLSLYLTDPTGVTSVRVLEACTVAGLVSEHLGPAADWSAWTPSDPPDAIDTPDARRRTRVWMAVGMVMLTLRLLVSDALALLRGQAYAANRTLDALADDLVEGRIHPDHLREPESTER